MTEDAIIVAINLDVAISVLVVLELVRAIAVVHVQQIDENIPVLDLIVNRTDPDLDPMPSEDILEVARVKHQVKKEIIVVIGLA